MGVWELGSISGMLQDDPGGIKCMRLAEPTVAFGLLMVDLTIKILSCTFMMLILGCSQPGGFFSPN